MLRDLGVLSLVHAASPGMFFELAFGYMYYFIYLFKLII